jgi:long-chain acyl-CoA synthetase
MLDFANMAACFEMHDARLDLSEQDVSLCMLPLSHVFERAWSYYCSIAAPRTSTFATRRR